ncbi:peptidoglycan bridge formation glycyltransferase FemA/FemB family protein [bacterium]|nr:MAG: peptidoglycan bridge formation glycyltransferase FemA/FemB family protein [bacterium]
MNVVRLSDQEKQAYDQFVAVSSDGSFLQSWDWGNFQTLSQKTAVRYAVYENKKIIATAQLLKNKVPHLPGYYLYSAYGPVIADAEVKYSEEIIEQLINQIKIDFPDCWFIRLESKTDLNYEKHAAKTIRIQPGKTLVTDLTQSPDDLQEGMHNKTRYNIKVAAKHNIRVEPEVSVSPQHGFHIAEFIELLTNTSGRQKFKGHEEEYYKTLIDFFVLHYKGHDNKWGCKVSLYKALYEKRLVAAAIMIDHGNTRTYLFGGSSDSDKNLMAPYAIHWQAMMDAKNNGLKRYDWWGIETSSGKTPGFVKFKLRWGGSEVSYPPVIDVVLNKAWYLVYKLLRKINRLF